MCLIIKSKEPITLDFPITLTKKVLVQCRADGMVDICSPIYKRFVWASTHMKGIRERRVKIEDIVKSIRPYLLAKGERGYAVDNGLHFFLGHADFTIENDDPHHVVSYLLKGARFFGSDTFYFFTKALIKIPAGAKVWIGRDNQVVANRAKIVSIVTREGNKFDIADYLGWLQSLIKKGSGNE